MQSRRAYEGGGRNRPNKKPRTGATGSTGSTSREAQPQPLDALGSGSDVASTAGSALQQEQLQYQDEDLRRAANDNGAPGSSGSTSDNARDAARANIAAVEQRKHAAHLAEIAEGLEEHSPDSLLPKAVGGEDNSWLTPEDFGHRVTLPYSYPDNAMGLAYQQNGGPKTALGIDTRGVCCINIPLTLLRQGAQTLSQFVYSEQDLGDTPNGFETRTTRFVTATLLSALGLHEAENVPNGCERFGTAEEDGGAAPAAAGAGGVAPNNGARAVFKKKGAPAAATAARNSYKCKHPVHSHQSTPMRWFGIEHLVARNTTDSAKNALANRPENDCAMIGENVHIGYRVWFLRWDPAYSEMKGLLGLMERNAKRVDNSSGSTWWQGSVLESVSTERPSECVNARDRKFVNNAMGSITEPAKMYDAYKVYGGKPTKKKVTKITDLDPYGMDFVPDSNGGTWSLSPDQLLDATQATVLVANLTDDGVSMSEDLLPAQIDPLSYMPWSDAVRGTPEFQHRHRFVVPPHVTQLSSFHLCNQTRGKTRNCMSELLPPSPVASNATPIELLVLTKKVVGRGIGGKKQDPRFLEKDCHPTSTIVQDAFLVIANRGTAEHISERARWFSNVGTALGEKNGQLVNPEYDGVSTVWPQRELRAKVGAIQDMHKAYMAYQLRQIEKDTEAATAHALVDHIDPALATARTLAARNTLLSSGARTQRALNEWSVMEVRAMLSTQGHKLPTGLMSKAKQAITHVKRASVWPRHKPNESKFSCFGAFIQKLTLFSVDCLGWSLDSILFHHMYFSTFEAILDSPKWVCMYFGERAVGKSHAVTLFKEMLLPNTFVSGGGTSAKQGLQGKCLESGHVLVYDEAPTSTTGSVADPERIRIQKEMLSTQTVTMSRCVKTDLGGKDEFVDHRYVTEHQEKQWYFANTSFMLDFCNNGSRPSSSTLALLDRHTFIFCRPAVERPHGTSDGVETLRTKKPGAALCFDNHHLLDGLASLLLIMMNCMPTLDPAHEMADEMFARYDHVLEKQHGAPPIESREAHGRRNLYKVICAVYAVHLRFFDSEGRQFASGANADEQLANWMSTEPPTMTDLLDCAPILAAPPPELIFYVHSLHSYTRLGLGPFFDHVALGLAETFSSTTSPTQRQFSHRPNSELFGLDRDVLAKVMPMIGAERTPGDTYTPSRTREWSTEWLGFPVSTGRADSICKSIYRANKTHDLAAMEADTEKRLRQVQLLANLWNMGSLEELTPEQERMLLPSLGMVTSVCSSKTIQTAVDGSMAPKATRRFDDPLERWSTPYCPESSVHFVSCDTPSGTRFDFTRLQTTQLGADASTAAEILCRSTARCGRLKLKPDLVTDVLHHFAHRVLIPCRHQSESEGFLWNNVPVKPSPLNPSTPLDGENPAPVPVAGPRELHPLHPFNAIPAAADPDFEQSTSLPGLGRHLGKNTWLDGAVASALSSGHLAGLALGKNNDGEVAKIAPFEFRNDRSAKATANANATPNANDTSKEGSSGDGKGGKQDSSESRGSRKATLSVAFKRRTEMAEAHATLNCKHVVGAGLWVDSDMADPSGEAAHADPDDRYDDDDDDCPGTKAARPSQTPLDDDDDEAMSEPNLTAQGDRAHLVQRFNSSARRKTGAGSWWNMLPFNRMLTCCQAVTWHEEGAPPIITPISSPYDQYSLLCVPLDRADPHDDPFLKDMGDFARNLAYTPKINASQRPLGDCARNMLYESNSDSSSNGHGFDWYSETDRVSSRRKDPYPSAAERSLRDRCLMLPDRRYLESLLSVRSGRYNTAVRQLHHENRVKEARAAHLKANREPEDFVPPLLREMSKARTPEQVYAQINKMNMGNHTNEEQNVRDKQIEESVTRAAATVSFDQSEQLAMLQRGRAAQDDVVMEEEEEEDDEEEEDEYIEQ